MHVALRIVADIDELARRKRHAHLPPGTLFFAQKLRTEHGIEDPVARSHLNAAESEFAGGVENDCPGFIDIFRFAHSAFKLLQPKLGIYHASKRAAQEKTAGDAELGVSEMLDTHPGADAEQHDNQPTV